MKRPSPVYASPFAAAGAAKRRKADRLIGDRLTVLPSSLLHHCVISLLSFEEWMGDIRQVNRFLRRVVEGLAVQWMNTTFPKALAILDKKEQKKRAREEKKQRLRAWAASPSSSSSSSSSSDVVDLTASSLTVTSASFTVADAAWVNRQIHQWDVSVLCNRGVDLSRHQRHLLRVAMQDIPSEFHVPPLKYGELRSERPVDVEVEGRRLSRAYWLMDVLGWVLAKYGHVEPFIALHQSKKTNARENQQRMAEERKKNKDPQRLKEAMEAEGVDWSEWKWDERNERWSVEGCSVWWDRHGHGRWRISCPWLHNALRHPELYALSRKRTSLCISWARGATTVTSSLVSAMRRSWDG